MKKQILFVIPSLMLGGAEKSLVTLLSLFDYEKYDVDLLIFRKDEVFFEQLPDSVNVIGDTRNYEMFDGNMFKALMYFAKKFDFKSAYSRVKYAKCLKIKDYDKREMALWKHLKNQLPKINKEYDCAIGYLEGNASYYVAEYPYAKKKICYFHSDFEELHMSKENSLRLFEAVDDVVTVSNKCLEKLTKNFSQLESKFHVIENIIDGESLKKFAESETAFDDSNEYKIIVSVGRMIKLKAVDLEVKSCNELLKRSRKIKWYHVGSGALESEIKALIMELGIENEFILLGAKSNPYPYIDSADIYVQTSQYEGKSIAIDEAKCLGKPIVVTNFTTVYDQIEDGINGLICQMDENDIADKIEKLIDNDELCKMFSQNLSEEDTGNKSEIKKLYSLIEG